MSWLSAFVRQIHLVYKSNYTLEDKRGSPLRFNRVGIEGPKISVSRMPLRSPRRAKARARFTGLHLEISQSTKLNITCNG